MLLTTFNLCVKVKVLSSCTCSKDRASNFNKKFRYRRGTTQCAMSVEILSTAAQLHEKSHLTNDLECHSRSSEMARLDMPCITSLVTTSLSCTVFEILLVVESFSSDTTVEIIGHVRRFQIPKVSFKVTQGHCCWCHSI